MHGLKRIIKIIMMKIKYHGKNVIISNHCNISLNTVFGGKNKICYHTNICNSSIDYGTYIGTNCAITNAKIGKYCSIANGVKTIVSTHPVKDFVSTHPCFFSTRKQAGFTYVNEQKYDEIKYVIPEKQISVLIGNDVWIGENVIILAGVSIGDGAVIGAGAIVTKDIEPYSINVGVPAKKINSRFSDADIDFLLKFKWWDKDEKWLSDNSDLFSDIKKFKGEFK